MSGFQPKNNLDWISVEIMLQPESNQNTTLELCQVFNLKTTLVGIRLKSCCNLKSTKIQRWNGVRFQTWNRQWLDFGCLTSQPDFNHGTTLKSGSVPSGSLVMSCRVWYHIPKYSLCFCLSNHIDIMSIYMINLTFRKLWILNQFLRLLFL